MKKIFHIIIYCTIFFILPSIGDFSILLDLNVLILIFFTLLIFITQPDLNVDEFEKTKKSDGYSIILIIVFTAIGLISEIIEWRIKYHNLSNQLTYLSYFAIIVMIIGTIIRIYSIYLLGKHFTPTVKITKNHKLIQTGIYSHVRHPSYLGAYLVMLGSSILLQSISGLIIFGIGMFIVYKYRIKKEENSLIEKYGSVYEKYMKKTYSFIPFLF